MLNLTDKSTNPGGIDARDTDSSLQDPAEVDPPAPVLLHALLEDLNRGVENARADFRLRKLAEKRVIREANLVKVIVFLSVSPPNHRSIGFFRRRTLRVFIQTSKN